MLDNIINLVKKEASDLIINDPNVPEHKKEEAVETTASTIIDGLKNNITSGNISDVVKLFNNPSVETSRNNNAANNIQTSVISALIQKVGLKPEIANGIATAIIPTVMSLLTNKVKDKNEPGFNLESVVGALTGGKGENILSSIGKFFGK